MALFDFLSKKPTPKKIEKLTARMLNEHHQQQVRQEAMDELVAFGTPEAILGLVRRLGVNFRDTIKNEQEKRYIDQVLALNNGNRTKTARDLGVDPRTVFRHLEKVRTDLDD